MAAGRKIKTGLNFFPVDVDIFQDIKIRKLIRYAGGHAISIYLCIISKIYKNGYFLPFDEDLYFIIAEETGINEEEMGNIVEVMFNVGLFDRSMFKKHAILTSKGIQERFQYVSDISRRKANVEKYNLITSEEIAINAEEMPIDSEEMNENNKIEGISSAKMQQTETETETESKQKEAEHSSGPPKSSDSKRKAFAPPTLSDVQAYFEEKGYSSESAEKAFNYYNVSDWKDGQGNKVKNWKQKMIGVWFRPENKLVDKSSRPKMVY